jgi:hypothetical protein
VLSNSPTLVTPALGTPSALVGTNITGTATSFNINGTVGATTPAAGAFTTLSATGVTTVQAGSAAAPAITTSGDTNTGIFFPAADTIAFSEGGVEAGRFDATGNFGLGATSLSAKFTVVGTGYSPNITLSDASTVAWNTALGQVATFTFVSSNRTMGAPSSLVSGAFYALAVIQNAGSNTLTWNSVFKWANGTAPTLSTAASARDYFVFRSDGTNLYEQGRSQGVA